MYEILFGLLTVVTVYIIYIFSNQDKKPTYKTLHNKHVVITGGSSGIGKSVAREAYSLGANVTILGRSKTKLISAVIEIINSTRLEPLKTKQRLEHIVLDVTTDYKTIQACFQALEDELGPIFMLVNCAGACTCGLFESMAIADIKEMVDLNYFGSAYPTHCVVSKMRQRDEGIIVFVASEASLLGIYGYSAYSAGKWAVRGLSEALRMEMVGTNVQVMLSYPPDTDTPGLMRENIKKPMITKKISGSGGLHSPAKVGAKLINDAINGKFYSTYSYSGMIMNILYGVSIESISQVIIQILFVGFFRAVLVGIITSFNNIVKKEWRNRKEKQKNKIKQCLQ